MDKLKSLIRMCRLGQSAVIPVLFLYLLHRLRGRNIIASRSIIRGLKYITTLGPIDVGLRPVMFTHRRDTTLLNIIGELTFHGKFSIGRGCRFAVSGTAAFGPGGYVNPDTKIVIAHKLRVGTECAISWGCQIVDDDFHVLITDPPAPKRPREIILGDHVWVGSNVSILKGTRIASGCVIAAGSVVTGIFDETGCLLAGVPAKVIRRGITWE